jgi:hypothetical protein
MVGFPGYPPDASFRLKKLTQSVKMWPAVSHTNPENLGVSDWLDKKEVVFL